MRFADVLNRLASREALEEGVAMQVMGTVMDGAASPAQIAAFLIGLRSKGETVDEIVGCARAIRSRAARFPAAGDDLVDTCGTGGDGAGTFNISTAAAFVAAGAGARVAKHGNRAVSSSTGSADVLEALGVEIAMAGPESAAALDHAGVAFLFAPAYHAAMRHAAPVRRDLGVRTVFNVLGPLCNPAGARSQVIGVFDRALAEPVARAAASLGARRVMAVHGADGLDEITITGPSHVAEWDGARLREYALDPAELGLPTVSPESLRGGDAAENAAILLTVLEPDGGGGPRRDIVLLNAAATLVVAGVATDLRDGLERARESVATGAARRALDRLVAVSGAVRQRRQARTAATAIPAMRAGWGR